MWKTRTRENWLTYWDPIQGSTTTAPFRRKWFKPEPWQQAQPMVDIDSATQAQAGLRGEEPYTGREAGLSGSSVQTWVFPLVDEIVDGLAIPVETIKGKDTFPHAKFLYIQEAMEDLVEYVVSGRYRANFLSEEGILDKEIAILRIAREEGVDVDRFTFE